MAFLVEYKCEQTISSIYSIKHNYTDWLLMLHI